MGRWDVRPVRRVAVGPVDRWLRGGLFSDQSRHVFPVPDEQITAITEPRSQAITDRTGLFFGKLNAERRPGEVPEAPVDLEVLERRLQRFSLALDRYPYSAPGAGFYAIPDRGPRTGVSGAGLGPARLEPAVSRTWATNGVFLYAEAKQATKFFGLPGKHVVAGLYGTGSFSDLAPASFIELPQVPGGIASRKTGTWTLLWNLEQRLWVHPDDPERGLGLYVQMGLGDGNPNPIRGF